MENGENKDLQGRREFFKKAAKKSLPVLGMAVLAFTMPSVLQSCSKTNLCSDCSGSCKTGCSGDCKSGCSGDCFDGCEGDCYLGCKGDCYKACVTYVR